MVTGIVPELHISGSSADWIGAHLPNKDHVISNNIIISSIKSRAYNTMHSKENLKFAIVDWKQVYRAIKLKTTGFHVMKNKHQLLNV